MAERASLPNRHNCLVAASFLIQLSLIFSISSGADTLYANQSLSGDQTLVSSGEKFELGFFKPGNSSNYYIGMWFKKVTPPTIAWVANREIPIVDRYSSELRIVDGNLVLFNESKIPIWSTNVSSTTSRSLVVVVLLDDGNLVLRDGSNLDRPVIWQSFDHPTHTWLPDGKIGYNNRTGTIQLLTSWKSSDDPAPGLFSLELDPIQRQCILWWNRSKQYWTSYSRNRNGQIYSLLQQRRADNLYNFSYISNENESYTTYSLHNPSIMFRFILDVSGQVKAMTWLENTQGWNLLWSEPSECDVYSWCGAFGTCYKFRNGLPICNCLTGFRPRSDIDMKLGDYSGGCVRRTSLQCGNVSGANVEKHGFFTNSGLGLPPSSQKIPVGSRVECESLCSNHCSCVAFVIDVNYDENYFVCQLWNDELLHIKLSEIERGNYGYNPHQSHLELNQPYIKLALSDIPSGKGNGMLGITITSVLFLVMLSCIVGYIFYRKVGRRRGKFLMLCIIGYLGLFL